MELNSAELAKRLNVSKLEINAWRRDGLPAVKHKNLYYYRADEVIGWLVEKGIYKVKERELKGPILTNRREVAEYFKVTVRTVAAWLEDKTFPGKSGKGTSVRGSFPVVEIAKWIQDTGKQAAVPDEVNSRLNSQPDPVRGRDRLVMARADQAEIRLREMQGKLLDAETYIRECQRQHSYVVTMLNTLPSKIIGGLRSLDEQTRSRVHKIVKDTVAECCDTISELLEGDKDDTEFGNLRNRTK